MSHRTLALIARTVLVLLVLTGCAATTGRATPAHRTPPCRAPGKAVLPHTDGTLTENDNGARICLARGQEIAVFLNAHSNDPQRRWQPITAQPETAVTRGNNGVMTLPIGTTAALFTPTATGDVQLTSRRSAGETWHATLAVR
ncbi:hypothetical protein [Streptomyces sp. NPDC002537]